MAVVHGYLKAITVEAQKAIFGHETHIDTIPFRVGRELRGPNHKPRKPTHDRREKRVKQVNELYLWEPTHSNFVSRQHFEIRREGREFFLIDRHSALGTWVEGQLVGGNRRGGQVRLNDGDVIIIGSHLSGFIFKFIIAY